MRQMELNFGQRLKGVDLEVDSTWKSGKTMTGKLTKKEMISLASTNQKLNWRAGVGGSNQKEEDESEIAKEEGAEDDSAVSTEPAGDPLQCHVVQLAGEGSSPETNRRNWMNQKAHTEEKAVQ